VSPISPKTQKVIAWGILLPSIVVLIGSVAVLLADGIGARRRAPSDKAIVESLRQAVKKDAAQAPILAAELDRQTAESLRREDRSHVLTRFLMVSVVAFLVCAKWLTWLGIRAAPARARSATRHPRRPSNGHPTPRPATIDAGRRVVSDGAAPSPPPSGTNVAHTETVDLTPVESIVAACGQTPDAILPILHAIQSHYGYLPDPVLEHVCRLTDITPAQLVGVSTFYPQFRRSPAGRHIIKVCHGTACHVAGAVAVTEEIRRVLDIPPGSDTDPQRLFTIDEVACLGCCTLAPVIQIDGTTYGHLMPDKVSDVLADFLASGKTGAAPATNAQEANQTDGVGEIRIGLGSCCVAGGSAKVRQAIEEAASTTGVRVSVKRVGCVGMCYRTPLVEAISPDGRSVLYASVSPRDARAIIRRHFRPASTAKRLRNFASDVIDALAGRGPRQPIERRAIEPRDPPVAAFLGGQRHIATEHGGRIDPVDLDDYLSHDGFVALRRCLTQLSPEQVIDEVWRSGLRGRGGAGYATGRKWSQVRSAAGEPKYVICNGDEGDPGAFMDRMLMESYPYRIIEGMAIAAYAVGATQAYFYVRAEYSLAVRRIREALSRCEEKGVIGDRMCGGAGQLTFTVREGAGAFVCGEETAMLASIEGRRGMPRLRPPYPAESGLWGKPTLVNNVETCAVIPWIIRNGAAAFAGLGTGGSKGTKVFALAGKVARGGLIEVPMGMTLRQIVEGIGGGVRSGRRFKAVQVGGPSGGCIPAKLADIPVDYEALNGVGAIMGSGGLVVLDDSDCMVDIARYFLQFTQNQSCGRCTFCRIGTRRMLDILNRLCEGHGKKGDLDELERLARSVKQGSLCGLGKTAPNPVLTTLRHFRDEYEAHLHGRCPAAKCRALITYSITEKCIGCTLCAQHCPADAIAFRPYERHEIDTAKCIRCGMCKSRCQVDAVKVE